MSLFQQPKKFRQVLCSFASGLFCGVAVGMAVLWQEFVGLGSFYADSISPHSNFFGISSHQVIIWEWSRCQFHCLYLVIRRLEKLYVLIQNVLLVSFKRMETKIAQHRTIRSKVMEQLGPRVLMANRWSVEGWEIIRSHTRRGASRWSMASGRISSTWRRSEPTPLLWLWETRLAFDLLFFYLSHQMVTEDLSKKLEAKARFYCLANLFFMFFQI